MEKERPRRANGEGSLIKLPGCRFWYGQYYDQNGRKIRFSTRTPVKQVALDKLRKAMGDRDRGLAPLSDMRKITYAQLRAGLLASYVEKGNKSLTEDADGSERIPGLKPLDAFFGYSGADSKGPSVVNITTDTAREFVRKRQAEGMGNAIINRSLACLRRMLRIAREDGKIQNVPVIRLLKEPPARRGFLPLDKFEELSKLLPTTLRPLITFLYYCGVRLGEALQIEWSQVDLNARLIRLEDDQTKTGEARIVPLPSVLVTMLENMDKTGQVFTDTNLRKSWHKACAACGLGRIIEVEGKPYDPQYEGLTIHDLRRSAIRNLVNAGVSERVAMRISGHKTRAVFDRYHIVNTDDVTAAMQRVETAGLLPNRAKLGKIVQARGKRKAVSN